MGDLRAWASKSGFLENPTEDATEKRTSAIQMDANQKDSAITTGNAGLRGWAEQSGFLNSEAPLEEPKPKKADSGIVADLKEEGGFQWTNLNIGWNNLKKAYYGLQMSNAAGADRKSVV